MDPNAFYKFQYSSLRTFFFSRVASVIKCVLHNNTLAFGQLAFDCLANLSYSFSLTTAQPQRTLCEHRSPDTGSVAYNCKKMTC